MIHNSVKLSFVIVEYYSIDEILLCQDAISRNIPREVYMKLLFHPTLFILK